jgi:hypothetical protein
LGIQTDLRDRCGWWPVKSGNLPMPQSTLIPWIGVLTSWLDLDALSLMARDEERGI